MTRVYKLVTHMLPRRRKANNLAQSLGRMSHVKSNTVTWLKSFEKQVMRDVPVAIHMYTTPPCDSVLPVGLSSSASSAPVVSTPVSFWPLQGGNLDVQVRCSFCAHPIVGGTYSVHHNYMLSSPYVLACTKCCEKTLESK